MPELPRFSRRAVLILGTLVLAISLAAFLFRVSQSMDDLEVYWRAGVRALGAESLYQVGDGHFQFKYLPAFAVLAIPLGALPLGWAKLCWFLTSVGLLALLLAWCVELLPERRKPVWLLLLLIAVAGFRFYGQELLLGQVHLLLAVLAVGALRAIKQGREAMAGFLVALGIVVKPYGIILLPWLLARRKATSVVTAGLGTVIAFLLPVVVYGWCGSWAQHRAWWWTVTDTTAPLLLRSENVSLAAMYARWVGPGGLASILATATVGLLGVLAIWMFAQRRGLEFPEGVEGAFLLAVIPMLSPQGWYYGFLLATPAVAFLVNYEDRLSRPMRALAIGSVAVMGLSLFDLMGRTAYTWFMQNSGLTITALGVILGLAGLRRNGIA